MTAWLAANAATIIISAVLLVITGLILPGLAPRLEQDLQ